ncbi:MAG: iron-containing alcohol dehydrogenase [Planctomycetota bacterium]|jgi:alcohol dehydrogenase
MNPFTFELPTTIAFGAGVSARLTDVLKGMRVRRALLVTDKGVVASGILEGILGSLEREGVRFEVFDAVEPNPKDRDVAAGAEAAKNLGAKCVVAVGGGSPIDCAKAICAVLSHGGKARDYEGPDRVPGECAPLVAVPTTAGTGSEVTFSSVVTDSEEKFKFSLRSTHIAPRVALADPAMTVSMPPALTASTGMDALTHAIEAYTAAGANALSDAAALHAVELVSKHLRAAVADGRDMEARSGMLLGSLLAGIAFSRSDVAGVHCIAEALGGMYDAPHGVCNAVVLPVMMEYNAKHCAGRYARIAAILGVEPDENRAVDAVAELARDVKLPPFRSLGVKRDDFDEIARKSAVNGSNGSNPRPMQKADYLRVLEMLWRR